MAKIIAIDHGNSSIKTLHAEYPAGLADVRGIAVESVEYKGRQYSLSHRRLPYMRDKTLAEDYFILSLFALGREMEGLDESVVLAVGLPPAHFKTGRDAFEDYFMSRSPITFRYNGCLLKVRVEQVLVFPQAYAAAMTRTAELGGQSRAFVVDIGGMTVDTLLLRHWRPDMAYTLSLEGGVNRLCNDIMGALSSDLGVRAEQDQVEAALRGEGTLFDEAALRLIHDTAGSFTARLLGDLRERDIDLQTTPSVFIGGGSLLLRRHIKYSPLVNAPVFVEDINANAVGYQLLAEAVLNK
jgi:plasmid segregation protein ParM